MPGDVMVYRISGAFFFGATARVNVMLDRVVHPPRVFILDFSDVPFIDITASAALERFVHRLHKAGTKVYFAGVRPHVRRAFGLPGSARPFGPLCSECREGAGEHRSQARRAEACQSTSLPSGSPWPLQFRRSPLPT